MSYRIVPDDVRQIQEVVRGWADLEDGVDWVITTGGTGFGKRDVTPEVGLKSRNVSPLFLNVRRQSNRY